jgi:hypothetical protein
MLDREIGQPPPMEERQRVRQNQECLGVCRCHRVERAVERHGKRPRRDLRLHERRRDQERCGGDEHRPAADGVNAHGTGMLCHQIWHLVHRPASPNSAFNTPSSTMRGSGSPGFRATRFVPVDLAQTWKSSSDAT